MDFDFAEVDRLLSMLDQVEAAIDIIEPLRHFLTGKSPNHLAKLIERYMGDHQSLDLLIASISSIGAVSVAMVEPLRCIVRSSTFSVLDRCQAIFVYSQQIEYIAADDVREDMGSFGSESFLHASYIDKMMRFLFRTEDKIRSITLIRSLLSSLVKVAPEDQGSVLGAFNLRNLHDESKKDFRCRIFQSCLETDLSPEATVVLLYGIWSRDKKAAKKLSAKLQACAKSNIVADGFYRVALSRGAFK